MHRCDACRFLYQNIQPFAEHPDLNFLIHRSPVSAWSQLCYQVAGHRDRLVDVLFASRVVVLNKRCYGLTPDSICTYLACRVLQP